MEHNVEEYSELLYSFLGHQKLLKFYGNPIPEEFNKAATELGFTQDAIESNGWQHDYWIYYKHPKLSARLVLEGSFYYGGWEIYLEESY